MSFAAQCAFRFALVLATAALAASPTGAAGEGGPPAAVVNVDPVVLQSTADRVPVIGRVVARRRGPVAARIAGPLESIGVEVGDRLEADQSIAAIDASLLRGDRDLVRGRLAQARAALARRKEEYALAREDRERLERLRATKATSAALYETAVRNEAVERARVTEAEAAVLTARSELGLADLRLGYASVRAPYAGVVVSRDAEEGAYLQTGQPVVHMVSDTALEIEVEVPYRYVPGLVTGDTLRVDTADGETRGAVVRTVLPQESIRTRTRTARLVPDLDGAPRRMVPGQSVTVYVPVGEQTERLTVHKDAVVKRGDKDLVYVVVDGVAVLRNVALGEDVGDRMEVLGGLEEGEFAVVRGNERLRPNDAVRIAGAP